MGSEMCIRDRLSISNRENLLRWIDTYSEVLASLRLALALAEGEGCLLYTSDAADDLLCVDLGGRRIIKKKTSTDNTTNYSNTSTHHTTTTILREYTLHITTCYTP